MAATRRTTFLIDGFNLYHSVCDASLDLGNVATKWLDIRAMCSSYLAQIGGGAVIQNIFYFSAMVAYRLAVDPDATRRQATYFEALRDTGVSVELGKFKTKYRNCPRCKKKVTSHEEKETDVAIGVKLMEVFFRDLCDTTVLVTGDSDLGPAVRSAKALFPQKTVYLLSPYRRVSYELKTLCPGRSFQIRNSTYVSHQFPNPLSLSSGKLLNKPPSW